jgi:heme/copper-type cytochrome/quinol oxidase subunit 4
MRSRNLLPVVLCAAILGSLRALACGNSMEGTEAPFAGTLWLDMLLWPAGVVLLNSVVLPHVGGLAAEGPSKPSGFRRAFFLLVSVCLVLLIAVVTTSAPFLDLSAEALATCSPTPIMLLMMLVCPAVVFVLHLLFFQRLSPDMFGNRRGLALATLVGTSVVIALVVSVARAGIVLPEVCGSEWSRINIPVQY